MIQYALKCADGHAFDSWFQSASAYDKLKAAGHVHCAVCGSASVEKALMAPRVSHGEHHASRKPAPSEVEPKASNTSRPSLSAPPDHPMAQAVAALKAHVEKNSDYVGKDFAREARKMHVGDAPERPIWGEANVKEAKELVDDGIPIAPLPFTPSRKTN